MPMSINSRANYIRNCSLPDDSSCEQGFGAMIAVLLLSLGAISLSVSSLGAVVLYADSVRTHELRIQASLNFEACLDSAQLIFASNYFITGEVTLLDMGCNVSFQNNFSGRVLVDTTSTLEGVSASGHRDLFNSF
jgi:hypothetical protein